MARTPLLPAAAWLAGLCASAASCNAEIGPPTATSACTGGSSCAHMDAVIAMSDQSSSGVGAISLDGTVTNFFGVDLGKDPELAVSGGRVFMVARDLDTVFELTRACGEPVCRSSTRRADHAGTTNPQDIAVAPNGELWVARFGLPNVAVLDASGSEIATITLPDLDGDGNPNASALRIVDVNGIPKAFVTVGLLDDAQKFRATRDSALVTIDVLTRKVEGTISLRARNPFNTIVEANRFFFFSAIGNFDAADETNAGIERVDPRSPEHGRYVIAEPDLGGSVSAVAVDGKCGAAIVFDGTAANATAVITFDAEAGAPLRTAKRGGALFGPSAGYDFWAITWASGRLLVGDRRRDAKGYPVRVFERSGECDLVERPDPIYVAQKPLALRAIP